MISATTAVIRQSAAMSSGPADVHGRQQFLARAVDGSQRREIHAIDGPAQVCRCPSPALRQFTDPGPCQLPFELDCQGRRVVLDGNA